MDSSIEVNKLKRYIIWTPACPIHSSFAASWHTSQHSMWRGRMISRILTKQSHSRTTFRFLRRCSCCALRSIPYPQGHLLAGAEDLRPSPGLDRPPGEPQSPAHRPVRTPADCTGSMSVAEKNGIAQSFSARCNGIFRVAGRSKVRVAENLRQDKCLGRVKTLSPDSGHHVIMSSSISLVRCPGQVPCFLHLNTRNDCC